jgi:hypothetical protein
LRYRITRIRAGEAKVRPPSNLNRRAGQHPASTIRALASFWAGVNPAQLVALTVTGCLTSRVAGLAVDELAGGLLEHAASSAPTWRKRPPSRCAVC